MKNKKKLIIENRSINEFQAELEQERMRRENLELQLDHCRQELERSTRLVREYEQKVLVLEKFLQHSTKQETKSKKQQARGKTSTSTATTTNGRSQSPSKLPRSRSQLSSASGKKEKNSRATTPTRKKSATREAPMRAESVTRHIAPKRDILDVNFQNFKINYLILIRLKKLSFFFFLLDSISCANQRTTSYI